MQSILQSADYALIIDNFIKRVGSIITAYQNPKHRPENANRSELQDVMEGLAAIANDPNGRADIRSVTVKGGKTKIRAALHFDTNQARKAIENMSEHIRLIEHHEDLNRPMVLMRFYQSNLKDPNLQKRSGEEVIIDAINPKPKPLVYASELARDRIKHEISDSQDNIYKKGFYVDVIVDMAGERVAAYKVTNFHQVIELPEHE